MEGLICFFIFLSLAVLGNHGSNSMTVQMCVHRGEHAFSKKARKGARHSLLLVQTSYPIGDVNSSKSSSTNLRGEKNRGWLGLSVFTSTFSSLVVRFKRIATLSAERVAASRYLMR
jgi:hypothetical protein